MDEPLSTEELYANGANFPQKSDPVYREQAEAWPDIDWERMAVSADQRGVLADTAARLHYGSLVHVDLLGSIIECTADLRTKRIATKLIGSRMRDVDAWGRYLTELQTPADIPTELEDYLHGLMADDHVESQVAGIALMDVHRYALIDTIHAIAEPTFRALMERDSEQSRINKRLTAAYLSAAVTDLDPGDRKAVEKTVDQHQDIPVDLFLPHVSAEETTAPDTADVITAATHTTDTFFTRIGFEG